MLLFIRKTLTSVSGRTSFNTSHVVIYPCPVLLPLRTVQVSIHLMLLFILFRPCSRPHRMCVSIHLMLLFITLSTSPQGLEKCFNTSHVVIYLMRIIQFALTTQSFNTSHVVIYLTSFSKLEILFSSFNTSHVVIYHKRINFDEGTCKVSIHLMLLFISTGTFLTM